jgi:hypothetical protein
MEYVPAVLKVVDRVAVPDDSDCVPSELEPE